MNTNATQITQIVSQKQDKVIHRELSYEITGILFKVHSELGNRFHERYYHRAMEFALKSAGINFESEASIDLTFEGNNIGKYRLDFIIDHKIVLELKTEPMITRNHIQQVLAYLKAHNLQLGIIANFRTPRLTTRRVLN